jgi:DNA-binding SARP family transcriptional activator
LAAFCLSSTVFEVLRAGSIKNQSGEFKDQSKPDTFVIQLRKFWAQQIADALTPKAKLTCIHGIEEDGLQSEPRRS